MKRPSLRQAILLGLGVLAALLVALVAAQVPVLSALAGVGLAGIVLLGALWLFYLLLRRFLWKTGRRLAFSYFLIGALPIPMVMLLLGIVAYVVAGSLAVHLFKDSVHLFEKDLEATARGALLGWAHAGEAQAPARDAERGYAFAYYRAGKRVAGDRRAPARWPDWAAAAERPKPAGAPPRLRFFSNGETITAAAGAAEGTFGVLTWYDGSLEREISRRTGAWTELNRPGDPGLEVVRLSLATRSVPLLTVRRTRDHGEVEKFFKDEAGSGNVLDRPFLYWGGLAGDLFDLESGRLLARDLGVTVNSTPRSLRKQIFPPSEEINTAAWISLTSIAVVLTEIYLIALAMAIFMIFGLSRAINQMSRATAAVQQGDFTVRIPVRRRDQLGALQRSFNGMAANLESLVATAAQKEALEKELSLAREVQKSLIPQQLPSGRGVEFATVFEPSAAIGGDYFDILSLPDGRLAVIIADVAGHGLSSGLRMAMLKASLLVATEEIRDPEEIFHRLDRVVRAEQGKRRGFVTATLAVLDLTDRSIEITNAGHPPTYLLRGGKVEEILLPGSPLGGLGKTYGRGTLPLSPGDAFVWLSDGLIEATNLAGDPIGYEGIFAALSGESRSAAEVRDRLMAVIARHTGGAPPTDDRTMVVVYYHGAPPAA